MLKVKWFNISYFWFNTNTFQISRFFIFWGKAEFLKNRHPTSTKHMAVVDLNCVFSFQSVIDCMILKFHYYNCFYQSLYSIKNINYLSKLTAFWRKSWRQYWQVISIKRQFLLDVLERLKNILNSSLFVFLSLVLYKL